MENMSEAHLRKHIRTNSEGQKTLDLSHKQLTEFPEAVTRMHHIEVLNLSGNQLTELPLYIYRLRKTLKELDVTFNNLMKLPESIGDLKQLTILKLHSIHLTEVPSSLTRLKNLKELYLSRNSLRELPGSIGDLKSLVALNLDHNELTTLPATITDLRNLQRLELGFNNLKELPKDFGDMQSLTILNIECSQLTVLPSSITRLVNLEQLMLRDNELRELPDEIGDLGNLTILEAANNLMTVLPSSFTRLKKLQRLELNGNKLEVLTKHLGELTNLTFLNVNNNPLTSESIRDVMDLIRKRKLETFGGGGNICFLYPSFSDPGYTEPRKELPQNFGKTLIFQDELKEEGAMWELKEAAARITFSPQAVTEPQLITCSLWNPKTLSPPHDENEALVSNVIELSRDGVPGLELTGDFKKEVTLTVSHSAIDLGGYEVVIRQLIDQENNEWKDLETTNTWHESDSTQGATSSGASAVLFPFAEAKLTQCSSFAVIWRLKSFTFSNKTTSSTPAVSFTVPEYPGVSVVFPESAARPSGNISLSIKVQEVPRNRLKGKGVLAGPVLHLSCSQGAEFLEPVTVTMPVSLRDNEKDIPDLSSCHVRVLYLNSEVTSPEWKEITDELESPVDVKDGVVTFQVKHFSVFWTWFDWCRLPLATLLRQASDLYNSAMRQEAGFLACLCDTGSCLTFKLALCCYPIHTKPQVKKDILASNIVRRQGEGNALQPMCKGDMAFVSLEALEPLPDIEMDNFYLRFLGDEPFLRSDLLVLVGEEGIPQVRFIKRQEDQQESEVLCSLPINPLPRTDPLLASKQEYAAHQMHALRSGQPSNEEMLDLAGKIVEDWKRLAIALGFSNTEVAEIDIDERLVREKAYQMLVKWKQKFASEATYRKLADGLANRAVERSDLVDRYCCE